MRSIIYKGIDLSDFCSAEVVEKAAIPIVPSVMAVPGRAGAMLLSGRVPPRLVRVRFFMDAGFKADVNSMADLRHKIYSALCSADGGTLRLPDEPEWEYRDAVCTDAGDWSSLFEDGHGDVEFTLLDPIAYGMTRRESGTSFEVGGSWHTWPTFELVAAAGSAVEVSCGGKVVRIEHAFTGGEVVIIDCGTESVTIGGIDARADVTLSSDFFPLDPGNVTLAFSGCSSHATAFHDRWL